jgi:hypothetical protein
MKICAYSHTVPKLTKELIKQYYTDEFYLHYQFKQIRFLIIAARIV